MDEDEMEIIVGTYEEFLLGYKIHQNESTKEYEAEQSFTNHSHSGSIRAVTVIGKYLASGSTDEAIRLINMGLRVEHGYMQEQSGTITCLTNYGSSYLFSGCEDGTICIWKSGSWICEKTLKAHKGGVTGVSVHPSGKLALSIGNDRTLKTWNLIKGRTGFVTNLHGNGDSVQWSPEGSFYGVGISNRLDIYSIGTAKVVYSIPFGKRVTCICFPTEDIVIAAGDKDTIEVHDFKKCVKLTELKVHKIRVKDMKFVEKDHTLVTASNCDECVKIWRFTDGDYSKAPVLIKEVNTTCRITCVTVWSKSIANIMTSIAGPGADEVEEEVDDSDEEGGDEEEKSEGDDDNDSETEKLVVPPLKKKKTQPKPEIKKEIVNKKKKFNKNAERVTTEVEKTTKSAKQTRSDRSNSKKSLELLKKKKKAKA